MVPPHPAFVIQSLFLVITPNSLREGLIVCPQRSPPFGPSFQVTKSVIGGKMQNIDGPQLHPLKSELDASI
jgi:hypothetical protein